MSSVKVWSQKKMFFMLLIVFVAWAVGVWLGFNYLAGDAETGVESPALATTLVIGGYVLGVLVGFHLWARDADEMAAWIEVAVVYLIWHVLVFAIAWSIANGTTAAVILLMSFIDIPVGALLGYDLWKKHYLPLF